jgi:hypothetical protein
MQGSGRLQRRTPSATTIRRHNVLAGKEENNHKKDLRQPLQNRMRQKFSKTRRHAKLRLMKGHQWKVLNLFLDAINMAMAS